MTALIMEMKIEPVVNSPLIIDGMIKSILLRLDALEPRRKFLFLAWLQAHSFQMKNTANLQEGLENWFNKLSLPSVQWEYKLILNELEWWRVQQASTVERLMLEYFAGSRSC